MDKTHLYVVGPGFTTVLKGIRLRRMPCKFLHKMGLLLVILVMVSMFSCAPKVIPVAPVEEKPGELNGPIAKTGWEVEWEKTLELGRKEGKVTLYSSAGNEMRTARMEAFPKKTGIVLEMTIGKTSALMEKALTERRNGIYLLDLFETGLSPMLSTMKGAGAFDPVEPALILPEVLNTSLWFGNKLPFADKEHTILSYNARPSGGSLSINTDYIKEDEITSYRDLLKPKYKGKIVINDPTTAGSGANWFGVYIVSNTLDLDYMRDLAKQEPMLSRDERQQVEWLARGKYPIGIALDQETINEFQKAGVPLLQLRVKDELPYITSGGANIALMNSALHPNAAKVYINWFLSKEGQTLNSRVEIKQSSRLDVPTDHLRGEDMRDPKQKYFYANTEEFVARSLPIRDMAKQVFTLGVK